MRPGQNCDWCGERWAGVYMIDIDTVGWFCGKCGHSVRRSLGPEPVVPMCRTCDFVEPRKFRCRKLEALPMVGEYLDGDEAPEWCPLRSSEPQTDNAQDGT